MNLLKHKKKEFEIQVKKKHNNKSTNIQNNVIH